MSEEATTAIARLISISDLALEHPLWKNPRTLTGLGHKELIEFGEDIVERGQIIPGLVQKVKADNEVGYINLVLDGQRRVLSVQQYCKSKKKSFKDVTLKFVDLYPEIIELTEESADRMLRDILAAAVKRAGLGSYEQVEAALQLQTRNESTNKQIGDAIGRSESWVSRMVRARRLASDKLVKAWANKKVTDEQFKELADINPHDKQNEALDELMGVREQGGRENKAAARNALKEKAAKAKAEKKAAAPAKKSKKSKKASTTKAEKSPADVLTKAKPGIAEIVALREVKKPTDPYVKGLMDFALYSSGKISAEDFASPWRTYVKQCAKADA